MKKFSYKIFREGADILLAVSDASILGKTIKENDIEIIISEDFYFDKFADETEIMEQIEKATIVNAIGKEIVDLLIKNKLVEKDSVLWIQGIPHAQVVCIEA